MQIMIDISEYVYKHIQESTEDSSDESIVIDAVKKGTPLDKIRAEIADLDDADYDYEGYYKAVTDALKIIDKYRVESEE